jgi:hypothetical protein
MANEADIITYDNKYGMVKFTVNDTDAIPKGTLVVCSEDPFKGTLHSSGGNPVGIAAIDKTASDGDTEISVITRGVVDMVADGAIAVGYMVKPGTSANTVMQATGSASELEIGQLMGRCLETAANGERVRILLNLG